MNHKCVNCGEMTEEVICHKCGYEDVGLKEHLAAKNSAKPDPIDMDHADAATQAEYCKHCDELREKGIEEDNRMVSLSLAAFELYEMQAALCRLPKTDVLDIVLDKIALLVEGLQNQK